jgi:hypothetical protein
MKRSAMKPGSIGLKRTAFARVERIEAREVSKLKRTTPARKAAMKTKQRSRTPADIELHDRMAALGCIACMKDGKFNPVVSIHHIDGRTKPDCHSLVLPLCAGHHQDKTGEDKTLLAVHPWKKRFEKRYGTQMQLLAECMALLTAVLQPKP